MRCQILTRNPIRQSPIISEIIEQIQIQIAARANATWCGKVLGLTLRNVREPPNSQIHSDSWVSRLSPLPFQEKIDKCRCVFTPMMSGLRWPGQTIMRFWPVRERGGIEKTRNFTSVQTAHTCQEQPLRIFNVECIGRAGRSFTSIQTHRFTTWFRCIPMV